MLPFSANVSNGHVTVQSLIVIKKKNNPAILCEYLVLPVWNTTSSLILWLNRCTVSEVYTGFTCNAEVYKAVIPHIYIVDCARPPVTMFQRPPGRLFWFDVNHIFISKTASFEYSVFNKCFGCRFRSHLFVIVLRAIMNGDPSKGCVCSCLVSQKSVSSSACDLFFLYVVLTVCPHILQYIV